MSPEVAKLVAEQKQDQLLDSLGVIDLETDERTLEKMFGISALTWVEMMNDREPEEPEDEDWY